MTYRVLVLNGREYDYLRPDSNVEYELLKVADNIKSAREWAKRAFPKQAVTISREAKTK